MANIIEILIAAKDEASATLQKVAAETSQMNAAAAASLTSVSGALLAYGAVAATAVAAVTALTKSFIDQAEALELMKGRTGISTENIQVLQQALKGMGLSAESGTTALTFLTRSIGNNNPALAELGIRSHDTWTVFTQLIDVFQRMPDVSERNALAFKLMGRSSGELLEVVDRLGPALGLTRDQMEKAGAIMGGDAFEAANRLKGEFNLLSIELQGVKLHLEEGVIPTITKTLDLFNKLAEAIRSIRGPGDAATQVVTDALLRAAGGGPDRGLLNTHSGPGSGPAALGLPDPFAELTRQIRAFDEFTTPELKKVLRDTYVKSLNEADAPVRQAAANLFAQITEAQADMLAVLQSAGRGLESGFAQVFVGLMSSAQTFRSAMKTIFDSMVRDILDTLGRLVAAKTFQLLLNFIPGIGPVASGVSGGIIDSTIGGGVGIPRARVGLAGGNTFIIQSIDSKSALQAIMAPTGSIRRANDRISEISRAT